MITKRQFDVLEFLIENHEKQSQRKIAEATGMSVGMANKVLNELAELKLIEGNGVSEKGMEVSRQARGVYRGGLWLAFGTYHF